MHSQHDQQESSTNYSGRWMNKHHSEAVSRLDCISSWWMSLSTKCKSTHPRRPSLRHVIWTSFSAVVVRNPGQGRKHVIIIMRIITILVQLHNLLSNGIGMWLVPTDFPPSRTGSYNQHCDQHVHEAMSSCKEKHTLRDCILGTVRRRRKKRWAYIY